jgi:hypothetical protein
MSVCSLPLRSDADARLYRDTVSTGSAPTTLPARVLAAVVAMLLLVGVAVVSLPQTAAKLAISRAVALLSEQQLALIMDATFQPVVTDNWIREVMDNLVTPTSGAGYTGTAMNTPEELWPLTGLNSLTLNASIRTGYELLDERVHTQIAEHPRTPLVIFGKSQSAIIASVEKRNLAAEYADRKEIPPVSFNLLGNPLRPNGGLMSRFPLLGQVLTPWTDMSSTPTDTQFTTYDTALQYDLFADFPRYPLNLLAVVNALFGGLNHNYFDESVDGILKPFTVEISLDPNSPDYQPDTVVQQYGDTTYYLIPSENLPMFYPLRWVGLGPAVDVVEPLVRVFVDLGYDRTTPYGEVARARLLPALDNLTVENAQRFFADVDDALQQGGEAFVDLFHPTREEPTVAAVAAALPAVGVEASPLQFRTPAEVKPVRSPKRAQLSPARAVSTPDSAPAGDTAVVNPVGTSPATETAPVDVTANEPRLGGISPAAEKPRDRVGARPAARTSNQQSAERN